MSAFLDWLYGKLKRAIQEYLERKSQRDTNAKLRAELEHTSEIKDNEERDKIRSNLIIDISRKLVGRGLRK